MTRTALVLALCALACGPKKGADEPTSQPADPKTEALKKVQELQKTVPPDPTGATLKDPPDPMTPQQRELAEAEVKAADLSPEGDDQAARLRYAAARTYYLHGELDLAVTLLDKVVDQRPDADYAKSAALVLLDTLNRQKKIDDLAAHVRKWLGDEKYKGLVGRAPELQKIAVQLDRHDAEVMVEKGDNAGCGKAFEALANAHPEYDKPDELWFNAAICYDNAQLPEDAKRAAQTLTDKFPQSPLVEKVKRLLTPPPPAKPPKPPKPPKKPK